MALNILVAPSGFKEGLDARSVADAIARGAARAVPDATISTLPLMDGGEGFTRSLVETTGGTLHQCMTVDPLGRPIEAQIGFLGGAEQRTAVLEIAAAAGLRLVCPSERDLGRASSAGVGYLIRHALDLGAQHVLIGCGDSGVNDAGAGLAAALGARFLDKDGSDIGEGALAMRALHRIDVSGMDPRLAHVTIDVAVNWKNALLGPRGVTRVYGPQKGASPELIADLEDAVETFARCVKETTGCDVAVQPGAGASGGIGAALAGLCGAHLMPRFEVVRRYLPFDDMLADADLVLTAEGTIDRQSACGKLPAEIASRARVLGIPVVALAGAVDESARATHATGVTAYFCIARCPMSLEESMREAAALIEGAAEQTVRTFDAGFRAAQRRADTSRPLTSTRRSRQAAEIQVCGAA